MFYSFNPSIPQKDQTKLLQDIEKRFAVKKELQKASHIFVFHEPKLQMYGCAFLHQKYLPTLLPSYFVGEANKQVWILNQFFIKMENEDIVEAIHHFDWHYENFFTSLYEQLINFTICRKVSEIFTYLDPEDHEDLLIFGKWPFEWEMGLTKGKLLGCLLFDPSSHARFRKRWRNSH